MNTVLADALINRAAALLIEWVVFQARMREIAVRGSWIHGGGVQGVVVFHDPEAIR